MQEMTRIWTVLILWLNPCYPLELSGYLHHCADWVQKESADWPVVARTLTNDLLNSTLPNWMSNDSQPSPTGLESFGYRKCREKAASKSSVSDASSTKGRPNNKAKIWGYKNHTHLSTWHRDALSRMALLHALVPTGKGLATALPARNLL